MTEVMGPCELVADRGGYRIEVNGQMLAYTVSLENAEKVKAALNSHASLLKALDEAKAALNLPPSPIRDHPMTERVKDGGPAFPHDNLELGDRHLIAQPGMSLRDWFAGQAMVAIQARYDAGQISDWEWENEIKGTGIRREQIIALLAYRQADAMLRAREKGNDHD